MERGKDRISRWKSIPGRQEETSPRVQVEDEMARLWQDWTLGRRSGVPKEEGKRSHRLGIPAGSEGKAPTAFAFNFEDDADLFGDLSAGWPDVEVASSSAGVEPAELDATDENLRKLEDHDTICRFPQYRGYALREIIQRNLEFTVWVMDTSRNHKLHELKQFQAWNNHSIYIYTHT